MELLIIPFVLVVLAVLTVAVNKSLYESWFKNPPESSAFCTINHKQLHVRVFGDGAETVLIVPPLLHPSEAFIPLAEELSVKYKVVLYDRPGYGRSEASLKTRKCKEILDEINELCRQLDLKKVKVLGIGEGAVYGELFCRFYPKCVSAFLAINPMLHPGKIKDQLSSRQFEQIFHPFKNVKLEELKARIGWYRLMYSKDEAAANHFSNPELYKTVAEEYSFVVDQGVLSLKIAPPFPAIPVAVIYPEEGVLQESYKKRIGDKAAIDLATLVIEEVKRVFTLSDVRFWFPVTNLAPSHAKNGKVIVMAMDMLTAATRDGMSRCVSVSP